MAGACVGALLFGRLTDRYGRKKLFMLALGIFVLAAVATAFAHDAWYLYLARFFTGMGIGGEYAAINSAIDEFNPRPQPGAEASASRWSAAMYRRAGAGCTSTVTRAMPNALSTRSRPRYAGRPVRTCPRRPRPSPSDNVT
ncbi:MFS transporter [Streptomyces sp. NPDC056437]|uniref:MFS transporter n=1 Tax=Streptomyces sp. NPDC056437 TaxID=3345816 RepID=UPI0036921E1F